VPFHGVADHREPTVDPERAVVLGKPLVQPSRHTRQILVDDVVHILVDDDAQPAAPSGVEVQGYEVAVTVPEKLSQYPGVAGITLRLEGCVGAGVAKGDNPGWNRKARIDSRRELSECSPKTLQVEENSSARFIFTVAQQPKRSRFEMLPVLERDLSTKTPPSQRQDR
jgi:hypothetical protein